MKTGQSMLHRHIRPPADALEKEDRSPRGDPQGGSRRIRRLGRRDFQEKRLNLDPALQHFPRKTAPGDDAGLDWTPDYTRSNAGFALENSLIDQARQAVANSTKANSKLLSQRHFVWK